MSYTKYLSVVNQYIVDLLKADNTLGFKDVWYGEENLVPYSPSASVGGGRVNRELSGSQYRTNNSFAIPIIIYHAQAGSMEITRKECDEFAELVEDKLHADRTMGGLVVHGYVTELTGGEAMVGSTIMAATRLTWEGISKTHLP